MEQQFTKKTYTPSQVSILSKSMLIASIAFIILGAASYGWSVLFHHTLMTDYGATAGIGFAIFFVMLIGGMVTSILWIKNMFSSESMGMTILCYALYILTTSLAFGWLFALGISDDPNKNLWWLPVMFVITGGVFLIALLISKILSINSVLTMGKMIGATAIAMMVFLIVFLVLAIVTATTHNTGVGLAADTICSLIMMGMAVISFLYVIIDIWQISKVSQFNDQTGIEQPKIVAWFFGYRLLTDLVNVLFIVLMFFLRFARRR